MGEGKSTRNRTEIPEKIRHGMLMINYLQTQKPQAPLLKLINRIESKMKTYFTGYTQRKRKKRRLDSRS